MHAQDDDDGPAAKRASALVTAMQTLMDIECALMTKGACHDCMMNVYMLSRGERWCHRCMVACMLSITQCNTRCQPSTIGFDHRVS